MLVFIFIIILSFLVLVHELGHFLMAKKAGVKVEEFGVGYPPKLVKLFTDKTGTEYTLNLLPFGGFVRLFGEENGEEGVGVTGKEFYAKPKKVRLGIIASGVIANFLLGVIAFGAIYTKVGIPESLGVVRIDEVAAGSPAEAAGLVPGDEVVGVRGEGFIEETRDFASFSQVLAEHQGETVWLSFSEQQAKYDAPVYVRTKEETPEGQGAIGVSLKDMEFVFYPIWQRPFRGMWVGLRAAVAFGAMIVGAIAMMFRDLLVAGVVPVDVTGPVGIGHAVVKEELLTHDLISITNLNFTAILSINLAIVNLLPIPALDGGRALLVMLEKVMGRRLRPKMERWLNMAGMVLVLMLAVVITFRDVKVIVTEAGLVEKLLDFVGRIK